VLNNNFRTRMGIGPHAGQLIALSVDGDSQTAIAEGGRVAAGQEYAAVAASLWRSPYGSYTNFAVSGTSWATRLSALSTSGVLTLLAAGKAAGKMTIAHCAAGHNDIVQSAPGSVAAMATTASSYASAVKTGGAQYMIAGTIYPTTDTSGPMEPTRSQWNAYLRANYKSMGIDVLCDYDLEPQLQNPSDTTRYLDGIHFTSAGANIAATIHAWAVMSLRSSLRISSVSVSSGAIAGGTTVDIFGSGFSGATRVAFHALPAASFQIIGDGHIRAVTATASLRGLGYVYVIGAQGADRLYQGWSYT